MNESKALVGLLPRTRTPYPPPAPPSYAATLISPPYDTRLII